MWITVLVLAVASNFEPSRPTLVPFMLTRPRPMAQLFALFCGCFTSGLAAGLLILFVFHQTPFGNDRADGAKAQIVIGMILVFAASIMATNFSWFKKLGKAQVKAVGGADAASKPRDRPIDKVSDRARAMLRRGNSPWVSGAIGLGIGLPSVDYLAVLVIIVSSGAAPMAQIGALLMFLLIGNGIVAIPLITYRIAPTKTVRWIEGFRTWIGAQGRRELAAILAAVGLLQVLIGLTRL